MTRRLRYERHHEPLLPRRAFLGRMALHASLGAAVIGAALGRTMSSRYGLRRPLTLLTVGLVLGFVWALFFNAFIGAQLGVFYYGRVIGGLALWEGTKHQYPLYDALAMGVQVMVFTYLLGRTDPEGRTIIDAWADSRAHTRLQSSLLSIAGFIVVGVVTLAPEIAASFVVVMSKVNSIMIRAGA